MVHAAAQHRPDVQAQRIAWEQWQIDLDPNRLVFLDETWVESNRTPGYGWGPTSARVLEPVPHGHWKTTTFVGALRATGLCAPLVLDGAINGAVFRADVEQQLAKELRAGDIVVMDNLPSHKVAGVAAAIRKVGAELVYLPRTVRTSTRSSRCSQR